MLTELSLTNFKCFRNATLALAGLTLLTGINGSGKSSVIQSLLLLRQSDEKHLLREGHGLLLDGDYIRLGRASDALFEFANEDHLEIAIRLADGSAARWRFKYDKEADVMPMEAGPESPAVFHGNIFAAEFCYLQAERLGPRAASETSEYTVRRQGKIGSDGRYTADFLAKFGTDEIPARGGRRTAHPLTPKGARLTLREQVELWMAEISPGVRITTGNFAAIDKVSLQYAFTHPGAISKPYRAGNVGFGLTYTLPIVTALLWARPGQLICVENPEAHLHPRGQVKIAELMCRVAASGVQIIVESHSEHVLNAIRAAVHDGLLAAEKTAIHFFSRGAGSDAGASVVKTPVIDADGRLDQWPEGFFDETDKVLDRLMTPREGTSAL